MSVTISWAKWGASGSAKRWANRVRDDLTPDWTVKVDACATHLRTIENIWDEKIESKSPSTVSDSNCVWLDKWECFEESSSTIPSECTPQRGDPFKRFKIGETGEFINIERYQFMYYFEWTSTLAKKIIYSWLMNNDIMNNKCLILIFSTFSLILNSTNCILYNETQSVESSTHTKLNLVPSELLSLKLIQTGSTRSWKWFHFPVFWMSSKYCHLNMISLSFLVLKLMTTVPFPKMRTLNLTAFIVQICKLKLSYKCYNCSS